MAMESTMRLTLDYLVGEGDSERKVTVRRIEDSASGGVRYGIILGDGDEFVVDAARPVSDVLSLVYQGRSFEAGLVETEEGFEVEVVGIRHDLQVMDPRKKALRMAEGAGQNSIKTQMPGRIVRILVGEGDAVEEGQALIVVEAMKMENEMKSPVTGTVSKVCVSEGDQVQSRSTLIELA